MISSSLNHRLFKLSLVYVLPTILLLVIAHLPSEITFIICLLLLICLILAVFLSICFFANEFINFDKDLDDFPPSSIPVIVITPPTEDHVTNLPPRYEEQDANFLLVIPRSSRRKRRSGSKSRSRSPKGGRESR
ncbi:secreted protein [Melampsora americana]|nr:secreted protein [Melampsora americana]